MPLFHSEHSSPAASTPDERDVFRPASLTALIAWFFGQRDADATTNQDEGDDQLSGLA